MATPTPPTAEPPPARALVERQLAMLTRLAEIGMQIAEAAGRRALATPEEAGASGIDPALAYAQAAKAVRMTIALQSQLMKDLAILERAEVADHAERVGARRARVHRIVERIIGAERHTDHAIRQLSYETWERLKDEDLCGDIIDGPIGEVVARICKLLGLTPDWSAWAGEAWALAEAASGAQGSPFVTPTAMPPARRGRRTRIDAERLRNSRAAPTPQPASSA